MSNVTRERQQLNEPDGAQPNDGRDGPAMRTRTRNRILGAALAVALVAAVAVSVASALRHARSSSSPSASALQSNPELDPGTPVSGRAADFTLTDQFGRRVSLNSFRGKVVILAFNDPVCTTVCPLTTTAMVEAKRLLGVAGSRVQLLGVGANPAATQVSWVRAYSQVHGMMHAWHFLNGPLPELKRVWHAYGIEAQVVKGQIDHTPALFVIDARGRLSRLYMTQMSYASVDQLGQLLAQSASRLLPGHPRVRSITSYKRDPGDRPGDAGDAAAGRRRNHPPRPRRRPHLVLFFDTWDSEVTDLAAHLEALNGYQANTAASGLPALIAVDEASVEPSPSALPTFLRGLPHPLSYPVAIDRSGQVADGYRVGDEPWLELISASGQFLWYQDVSTAGWPSRPPADITPTASTGQGPKGLPAGRRRRTTRQLARRPRRAARAGRPTARVRLGAEDKASRPARLPDRAQHLGLLVHTVPKGVPAVRHSVASLRPPGRISRRRHQRLRRRRAGVPQTAPGQLSELPEHHRQGSARSRRSWASRRRSTSTGPARSSTSTPANTAPRPPSTPTSAPLASGASSPL